MIRQAVFVSVLLLVVASCGTGNLSAPLGVSGTITVLPVNNRTADPLLVQGAGLIDRYIRRTGQVTVGDVLQSEARFRLQEKGFDVGIWELQQASFKGRVPTSRESALVLARESGVNSRLLYLEIRRWEPDSPMETRFVIVAMTASLIDAPSGQEIWRRDRTASPVPTQGTITLESAYVVAARKVIAEILTPLRPSPLR
jgi:hypothetical protein